MQYTPGYRPAEPLRVQITPATTLTGELFTDPCHERLGRAGADAVA
jgi:hypothetical protein